jgi:oligopeptide transport system substrate-binding protein
MIFRLTYLQQATHAIYRRMPNNTLVLGLFLLMLNFISCNTNLHNDKNVFRYNEDGQLTSLDPAFARTQPNTWLVNQLYNGLVQMGDQLEVLPCIAKSWDIDQTKTVYTFHLRNDVHFHNDEFCKGRIVTANDFKYSFERLTDKKLASPGAWALGMVMKDQENNSIGFEVINDTIFIIKLKQPYAPFLRLLTQSYCCVVPKESVLHWGKDFRNHPVGTGPFTFFLWDEGVKLILHKNENYFEKDNSGNKLPYLDAVSISFIDNKLAAFLAFTKGELDFFNGLESNFKDEVLHKDGTLKTKYKDKFTLQCVPYLNTEYLGFLVDDTSSLAKANPVSDINFRKAVNFAINRNELVSYLRNNIGTPATRGFTSLGFPMLDSRDIKGYTYNLDSANYYMQRTGLLNKKIELPLYTIQQYLDIAVLLQNQLAKIGISVKIEVNQNSFNRGLINKGRALFFRGSWIADYPDPENFLGIFYSKNFCPDGPNYTHFKNSAYDALYEKSVQESNDSIKYNAYAQMENIITENAPVVTLFYDKTFRLLQNNIVGLSANPQNILVLKLTHKN